MRGSRCLTSPRANGARSRAARVRSPVPSRSSPRIPVRGNCLMCPTGPSAGSARAGPCAACSCRWAHSSSQGADAGCLAAVFDMPCLRHVRAGRPLREEGRVAVGRAVPRVRSPAHSGEEHPGGRCEHQVPGIQPQQHVEHVPVHALALAILVRRVQGLLTRAFFAEVQGREEQRRRGD